MSTCHPHEPEPSPASPEALWGIARGCWEAFALLFGTALQLVGEIFIKRAERNQANAYLRALEALVRRLLLVEAAATEKTFLHPQSGGRWIANPAGDRETEGGTNIDLAPPDPYEDRLDTEDDTKWPAHFALRLNTLLGANRPDQPGPARAAHRPARPPQGPLQPTCDQPDPHPRFAFAAPLALRFEAVRRVIADPAPYIRRTARALAAFRRRNRPPQLRAPPTIPGDNSRFFLTPLKLIETLAAAALAALWPDTS